MDHTSRQLYNRMIKALLPDHGLSRSTIGTRESIGEITQEMTVAFKEKWYFPNNATLLITGPVDEKTVIPMLKRHLRDLPKGSIPDHPWAKPIEWDGRKVSATLMHPKVQEPFFSILIKAPKPPEMTREDVAHSMRILGDWLNSSTKSSPRKALYFDDFTLSQIDVYAWPDQADTINLEIIGTPEVDIKMEDAIAATWAFFDALVGIPKDDFDVIQNAAIAPMQRQKDQPRFEQNVAFRGLLERGKPYSVEAYIKGVQAVQPAHISALLNAFQTHGISVTGTAYPEEKQ